MSDDNREVMYKIEYDERFGQYRILCKNVNLFEDLRTEFSAENDSAFFVRQYGYNVDTRKYLISKFGYFDSGLIFKIFNYIKNINGDLKSVSIRRSCYDRLMSELQPFKKLITELNIDDFVVRNISEDRDINDMRVEIGKQPYNFRDYQYDSIRELILTGLGRGLIEIPTGGGKSFIIANLIYNIECQIKHGLKYLILVPTKQLVDQFYSDLLDYGYTSSEVSRFTGGLKRSDAFDPNAMIIVANRQYLQKNLDKLPQIGCLIVDEVHTAVANGTKNLIDKLGCNVRFGCSGTLPRGKYEELLLLGMFGKVLFKKKITELQKHGYISNLNITLLDITDEEIENNRKMLFNLHSTVRYMPDEFGFSDIAFNEAYKAEEEYMNKNYDYLYSPVLNYVKTLNGNTLILFKTIEFGKRMFELAKTIMGDKHIFYIDGSIKVSDREDIRKTVDMNETNAVIFGQTAVFSTGINIKNLKNVCFSFSGKSFSRTIQSIGRALRLAEGKECANLIDCVYNYKYSRRHYAERQRFYTSMYGKPKPDNVVKITI